MSPFRCVHPAKVIVHLVYAGRECDVITTVARSDSVATNATAPPRGQTAGPSERATLSPPYLSPPLAGEAADAAFAGPFQLGASFGDLPGFQTSTKSLTLHFGSSNCGAWRA